MPRKRKIVGLARKITKKELRGYSRTLMNPLGVTTLAKANGRGAASVRAISKGKSRSARLRRAKAVLEGASMKRIHIGRKAPKRRLRRNEGKAERAYREEQARLLGGVSTPSPRSKAGKAAKAAKAARVSSAVADYEKSIAEAKADNAAAAKADNAKAIAKAEKRAGKPLTQEQKDKIKAKRKAIREASYPKQTKAISRKVSRTVQVAFGPYRRARVLDPIKGKTRLSYMYVSKRGKKGARLRHIPASALITHGLAKGKRAFTKESIEAARKRLAKRVELYGGPFTPNKKRKSMAKKKSKKAGLRKATAASKRVATRAKAIRAKHPKMKWQTAQKRAAAELRGSAPKKARKTAKKGGKKTASRKTAKKPIRKTAARKTAKKGFYKFKKLSKAQKAKVQAYKTKHKLKGRGAFGKARYALRMNSDTDFVMNGRRKSRKHRRLHANKRHTRRHGFRRNGFMADFLKVLQTGAIVGAGFLTHRLASNLVVDMLLVKADGSGFIDKMADGSLKKYLTMFAKPLTGLAVVALGVPATQMLVPSKRVEIGAGMVASLIQQLLISGLTAANQPNAAKEISGYDSNLVYALHGQSSIMPHYTPVGEYFQPMSGLGAYTQAAAGIGSYSQAAAGIGAYTQAAAGYRSATGEYFAPAGLKGVGDYENAGELAMLPSNVPTRVEDGIRPDTDLDHVLDLAESASGVRGVGEYYSAARASGGGYDESIVPQQSQWIPNGPMWSGTLNVKDDAGTSELPAGILASGGGNGILSS